MAAALQHPIASPDRATTSRAGTAGLPRIRANHGEYVDQTAVGWMRPTPNDLPLEEMRSRFREDGYLWVKGLIPREDVLDMREHYFHHLLDTNILEPGTSPRNGIFNHSEDPLNHGGVGGSDLPSEQLKVTRLVTAHTMPEYLHFLEHPSLRSFIRRFMSWEREVIVRRAMLRHNVPEGLSTGIHYDKIFLRAGEAEFLTSWIPIGDCAANGGGLIYMEDSARLGRAIEADFTKRANEKSFTEEERTNAFNVHMNRSGQLADDAEQFAQDMHARFGGAGGKRPRWLMADYEAGDVVFHDPYMIHGAGRNEDKEGRIRLSCDLRFYEAGAACDERWMKKHWSPDDGL
ncbi:hypothetical protein FQN54_004517 [Arachnomyces sp. PD_36]|nr:hypothetical protein FQN54_004517 [Arachnomyces sp. PD_36]